jgi:hypothetical protein
MSMKIGESYIYRFNTAVCCIPSFVHTNQLNWIGNDNRMDSTRKLSQVFNNNPQEI